MNTLIVYMSRYGSTRDLVTRLRAGIHGQVDVVDLKRDKVPDLDPYHKVVIGGPVYAGIVPRRIIRFCDKHQYSLISRKVGIFVTCMSGHDRAVNYMTMNYPSWLVEHAFIKETLGGKIVIAQVNLFHRLLLRMTAKVSTDKDNINPDALDRLTQAVNQA